MTMKQYLKLDRRNLSDTTRTVIDFMDRGSVDDAGGYAMIGGFNENDFAAIDEHVEIFATVLGKILYPDN